MSQKHHLRLLSPPQRTFLFVLLLLSGFLLVESLYLVYASRIDDVGSSPYRLPPLYQGALLAHLVVGVLSLVLAVVFTLWHLKRALLRKTPGAIASGLLLLAIALFLGVSGAFILSAANSEQNAWAFLGHQIAAVALPLLYLFHRLRSKDRPPLRVALRWGGAMALGFALLLVVHGIADPGIPTPKVRATTPDALTAPASWLAAKIDDPFVPFRPAGDIDPKSPFFPAATTTTTGGFLPAAILHRDDLPDPVTFARETTERGFATSVFLGAQTCQRCHPDVTAQWAQSAHRFASFNNPFYRRAVEGTRNAIGKQPSQFCGGCHDPAIMLAGNMIHEIDPMTPESQAGLTCLACHAIDEIHNNTGNGNYNIQDELPSPYAFDTAKSGLGRMMNDYLIKAKPTVHKRSMLKAVHRTSEFCGTCHKVNLDVPVNGYQWLRGQNEYDAWHNSGAAHNNPQTFYEPPATKTCQDCHMPPEEAIRGDVAAKNGHVKSHRFFGVNTALPAIRGDEDMIRRTEEFRKNSLRVDVFAVVRESGTKDFAPELSPVTVSKGETIRVDVVVRNKGVGHTFPGGTNDSNQGWVHFKVTAKDRVLVESGAVGDDRRVDPAAHFYQAVLVDKHGQRIAKRNAQDIYTTVYANVIPPSGSDVARYRFTLPNDVEGPVTIEATVKWRKFNRTYTEFVFEGQEVPDLPISALATHRVTLDVNDAATSARPAPSSEWMRYNDYGISLLRDGDTKGALEAFEQVRRIAPDRVDGPRNLARVHLRDGDLAKAEAMMREASERAPEDPKNAFFWGRVLADSGKLDEAEFAFQRTLERYPDSRDTHEDLAMVYWSKGEFKKCIASMLEVLRIDPEHRQAHYRRSLCYEALASGESDATLKEAYTYAASEAKKAFEKYKLDENAQKVTRSYRQAHPHDNRMAQPLLIHELTP